MQPVRSEWGGVLEAEMTGHFPVKIPVMVVERFGAAVPGSESPRAELQAQCTGAVPQPGYLSVARATPCQAVERSLTKFNLKNLTSEVPGRGESDVGLVPLGETVDVVDIEDSSLLVKPLLPTLRQRVLPTHIRWSGASQQPQQHQATAAAAAAATAAAASIIVIKSRNSTV
eukprot:766000-Hanusia_phi.AAC.3